MIKKNCFLILIIGILFLNSCVFFGEGRLFNDDGKKADKRLEEIIEFINKKDKNALKEIFSEQALNEASDIDERIDYLFEFVQGEIKSWEVISHGSSTDSIDHDKREKTSMSWYYMNTDNQKFLIAFLEWLIDTENPENVGVYMLQVIKAEDKEQFKGFGPSTRYAGIYKPEE